MEFTKKELYEIEKRFDIHAGQTIHGFAEILVKLNAVTKESKFVDKLFEEAVHDYDLYRSISAKCKRMSDK